MNNPNGSINTQKTSPFFSGRRFLFSLTIILTLLGSFIAPIAQKPIYAVDVPSLLRPADGVTITATGTGPNAQPPVAIPEFAWSEVQDATKYRLQISQDIAFSTKFEFTTPMTVFTPPSVANFNDGLWYWRVRADAPTAGDYSEIRSFTRQWASYDNLPVLVSPAEGENLEFFDAPTFSWDPVIGAGSYRLQIAASPDFSATTYNQTTVATTHQPLLKIANGTFYWRVIPLDPKSREGTYSEMRSFVISYNQIPELLTPTDNSFPTFTPTFHWKAVRGAQKYVLQYSTDPTFNTGTTTIETRNTTYTPLTTIPNDVNYYWRVRTYSGNSISDWSEVWSFIKRWYLRPVLLTPVNNFQHVRFPTFTWSPVPGASYYKFELDDDQGFVSPYPFNNLPANTSNNFFTPSHYIGSNYILYWRVTPFDGSGKQGKESLVSSYVSYADALAPDLIYPHYYYEPENFNPPPNPQEENPYVDRTVALPVFYWHRLTLPPPTGGTAAYAYRIEVCTDPLFDPGDIVWTAETENTHAAPTAGNPFDPIAGQDYFWRVRALGSGGGEIGEWSQIWRTRIDLNLGLKPTSNNAPQLLRPAHAAEILETMPLLEWWPKKDAVAYDVQISDNPTFATTLDTATVPYPVYSPADSLAQRLLGRTDYGTFYWRVRARSEGSPLGSWSEIRRFQIASQSERVDERTIGDPANQLTIAEDDNDTADDNFELTTLFATQDTHYWYFGFNATATATNMTYALYLDLDHVDGSGATSDAQGYSVTTYPAHQPEFAIYISQVGSGFAASQTAVYGWNGSAWNSPQLLSSIGGELFYDGLNKYVEIKVPNTAIGMQDDTGSYALSLISLPSGSGAPQDSVPSDPQVPGSGPLSRFASVSERLNPVWPANYTEGEPAFHFVPPFSYDYPTGSGGASPWNGARMGVYLDPLFTTQVAVYTVKSNVSYYASTGHHWPSDLEGDNTYYWRIQPCYLENCKFYGAWSQGWRFDRQGFVPSSLQESVSFATPSFSWDIVEGAQSYDLQVDTDPNFGSPDISIRTAQNSYTHPNTLNNGTYYWRVRVTRYPNNEVINEWSPSKSFTLTLPVPQGLTPNDADPKHAIHTTPTFCWTPLIKSSNGVPVLAAYKYRLQVSRGDPTFSAIYEQVETEQSCWTPTKGYDDGTYYWRVAMLDGLNKLGGYSSPAAVFTKQYPVALPFSPADGAKLNRTPTFVWTAGDGTTPYVFGAASYKLEVSQYATFSPIYDSVTTDNTRYTPPKTYEIGRTYYWRVAIVDKDGKVGPFSDAWIIVDPNEPKEKVLLPLVQR